MTIKGQCGFIFLNNVSADGVARVAAHELGHGIFSLRHTLSTKNTVTLPQGNTDNLMDYPSTSNSTTPTAMPGSGSGIPASRLNKYQWDYIHEPQTMLFAWAEEEEEGAMKIKLDSLPEGNYRICIRENMDNASKIDTIAFYLKTSICGEYEVKNISWLSQFSTEIKGRKCHWCSTWGECCDGGTPCDTCPKDKKSKCCYETCKDSTLKTACDSCNNKKICDKSKCKTNNCCYETCLAMIEKLGLIIPDQIEPPIPGQTEPGIPDEIEPLILG